MLYILLLYAFHLLICTSSASTSGSLPSTSTLLQLSSKVLSTFSAYSSTSFQFQWATHCGTTLWTTSTTPGMHSDSHHALSHSSSQSQVFFTTQKFFNPAQCTTHSTTFFFPSSILSSPWIPRIQDHHSWFIPCTASEGVLAVIHNIAATDILCSITCSGSQRS